MENVREYLNKLKAELEILKDEELALQLGVSKSAMDKWIQRNKIPDKWIYVFDRFRQRNINNSGSYIHNIKKNEGNINQGGVMLSQASPEEKDPRAQVLLERYKKLSEEGKIEAENCVNNIYLKELRSKNVD